jgi:hypothetical protein
LTPGAAGVYPDAMIDLQIVSTREPDEVRTFPKGRFETYRVGPMTLGVATYEPGWRWSADVASRPDELCQVEHVGYVLEGAAMVKMADGREARMTAGDFFSIGPGHDSWVDGDDPYVSLHIMGGEQYAKT